MHFSKESFTFLLIWRLIQAVVMSILLGLTLVPIVVLVSAPTSSDQNTPFLHVSAKENAAQAIQCSAGYTPTVYATGLSKPDGLAFGAEALLYVVEETAGRVSRLSANGLTATTVLTGLRSPEGIAFDDSGNMYVTEDIKGGRIVKMDSGGITETLVTNLDNPEGVVWVDDGSPTGTLYVTEQNLEYALSISSNILGDYRTHVTTISSPGIANRIFTKTAQIIAIGPPVQLKFWSYAGLTTDSTGLLYFTSELSGQSITGTFMNIPFEATADESIFTLNPTVPSMANVFADDLTAPEGLRFSHNGFPLYVTEEDTGNGFGQLSQVDATGKATPLCTGFGNIEDVVVGSDGTLYVSEDSTGRIIAVDAPPEPNLTFIWLPIILRQ